MDETNINVLVQSIERSLHLIYKNPFSVNNTKRTTPYCSTGGSLRCHYGDGNENVKKQLVKISKTTTQHVHHAFYWATCAPSHKMGFRSSAAKNGLPGEGRHEGLVPRNDVLTNGFI